MPAPVPIKAQQDRARQLRQGEAEQQSGRLALVIGNGAYANAPSLKNPPNDALDVADALSKLGFSVEHGVNTTQRQMKFMIRQFGQKLKGGGQGLFYYAGHGVQLHGRNYLIPVDADIQSEADAEDQGVDLNLMLGLMDEAGNGLNVVILDACRDNPFARSFRSAAKGLAQVDAPTGMLIAYSTAPGKVARDGSGRNGTYTAELLKQMRVPGLVVEELLKRVRANVKQETNGEQVPWEASSLVGDFYFNVSEPANATKPISLLNNSSVAPVGATLPINTFRIFGFDTVLLNKSGNVINQLHREARSYVEELGGGVTLEMVEIPAGTFFMGSNDQELQGVIFGGDYKGAVEQPKHFVKVPAFYIGKFEITQKQWRAIAALPKIKKRLKLNPSNFKGDNLPVDSVSWEDAVEFCARLSRKTGREYRLPSEAEWEYAARANTTTLYASGDTITTKIGNCCDSEYSELRTSEVGALRFANGFGIYDTQGNVQEWCSDVWHDNYIGAPTDGSAWLTGADPSRRVVRGCSFPNFTYMCRSAMRFSEASDNSIFKVNEVGLLQPVRWNPVPDGSYGPELYGFRIAVSSKVKVK